MKKGLHFLIVFLSTLLAAFAMLIEFSGPKINVNQIVYALMMSIIQMYIPFAVYEFISNIIIIKVCNRKIVALSFTEYAFAQLILLFITVILVAAFDTFDLGRFNGIDEVSIFLFFVAFYTILYYPLSKVKFTTKEK